MTTELRRLHLGCGPGPQPNDWINVDGSWNAWFTKVPVLRQALRVLKLAPKVALEHAWDPNVVVHDITKGLPYPDASMSAIYSSHLLEHLYFEQSVPLLRECQRVLVPGGVLRVVVPDLRAVVMEYVAAIDGGNGGAVAQPTPADVLNERLMYRHRHAPSGRLPFRMYSALKDFHTHKWMYDSTSLTAAFAEVGLVDIRVMSAHVSRIPGIEGVEQIARVEDKGLCVEGIRP
jgi:predicted SAM-dependent methyltransferase